MTSRHVLKSNVARAAIAMLIAMHPRRFREEFGAEMQRDADSALEVFGAAWLLRDAAVSLGRQRMLRRWRGPERAVAATGLRSGVYPLAGPSQITLLKLMVSTVLSFLLFYTSLLTHTLRPY